MGKPTTRNGVVYDFDGAQGGEVGYGLAWAAVAIPEPATATLWFGATGGLVVLIARRRRMAE